MLALQVHLTLPAWAHELVDDRRVFANADAQVGLAIELSRLNIEHGTGGPFGAAVFDAAGQLVGIGVNRVVPQNCSLAHAEIMAYMSAQQRLQSFRLNANGPITLATSSQPCCQCYGATVWAGIDQLLIGARADDVETLTGFDEGPLPADWVGELEKRGIRVQRDVQREAACAVLAQYREMNGMIY